MGYRRSPIEAVLTSVVSRLTASTGVTGLATNGVHTEVPQGLTGYDYVEVTSPAWSRADTYGRKGAHTLVQVKAVGSGPSKQKAIRILDQCVRAMTGSLPTASQHTVLSAEVESGGVSYAELVNGVRVHHEVGMFRVWTEQSSS